MIIVGTTMMAESSSYECETVDTAAPAAAKRMLPSRLHSPAKSGDMQVTRTEEGGSSEHADTKRSGNRLLEGGVSRVCLSAEANVGPTRKSPNGIQLRRKGNEPLVPRGRVDMPSDTPAVSGSVILSLRTSARHHRRHARTS